MKLTKLTRNQIIPFLQLFALVFVINLILNYVGIPIASITQQAPVWFALWHGLTIMSGFGIGVIAMKLLPDIFLNIAQAYFMIFAFIGLGIVTPFLWSLIFYYPYRKFIYLKWKK